MDLSAIERALHAARLQGDPKALTAELVHQGWIPPADLSDHPPRKRAGREEARLGRALQQLGLSVIQQYPVVAEGDFYSMYFIDLTCGGVAIEVESGESPRTNEARRERTAELICRGWSVCYLLIGKRGEFAANVPQVIAEHIDAAEMDEAPLYVALNTAGHLVETGTLTDDGLLEINTVAPRAPVPATAPPQQPFTGHRFEVGVDRPLPVITGAESEDEPAPRRPKMIPLPPSMKPKPNVL